MVTDGWHVWRLMTVIAECFVDLSDFAAYGFGTSTRYPLCMLCCIYSETVCLSIFYLAFCVCSDCLPLAWRLQLVSATAPPFRLLSACLSVFTRMLVDHSLRVSRLHHFFTQTSRPLFCIFTVWRCTTPGKDKKKKRTSARSFRQDLVTVTGHAYETERNMETETAPQKHCLR